MGLSLAITLSDHFFRNSSELIHLMRDGNIEVPTQIIFSLRR